ncbi:MAG: FUSC family protein [Burkholderiaceae bacterium]|nr:FUSC family protein [Microbacteriaceae bacterium]
MRPFASLRSSARAPLLQVLKTSVAAVAAWLLSSVVVQESTPIFAAIAALLVVQPSVTQSLAKGVERSIGVILGVVLAFTAGALFGATTWVILAAIVVALLVAWALRLSPGSSNQIPISAMLVLAIGSQTPAYALDRIVETVIGALVGLTVNAIIVPPVLVTPAHTAVVRLAQAVAVTLDDLATSLSNPADHAGMLEGARRLRDLQSDAVLRVDAAAESLSLNPRGRHHRAALEADRLLLARLATLVTRTIGMARAVHDNHSASLADDPLAGAIATELGRAAHDVRLLAVRTSAARPDGGAPELPALTAPLIIARPDPRHWILVGSLLEDLRRIREEITGVS